MAEPLFSLILPVQVRACTEGALHRRSPSGGSNQRWGVFNSHLSKGSETLVREVAFRP